MPELPFLEVLRANLSVCLAGRRIERIDVRHVYVLKSVVPPLESAAGRVVDTVRRRGKYLIVDLAGGVSLVLHLMKAGRLRHVDRAKKPGRDTALVVALDDGMAIHLTEAGSKKRASVWLLASADLDASVPLAGLGPEPLSDAFTAAALSAALAAERSTLKRFLVQQRAVAGIGNGFSDEILWEARLSPFARTDLVDPRTAAELHAAIVRTLRRGLEENQAAFGDTLPVHEPVSVYRVHRRAGQPCPRCGDTIRLIGYAERETYYCPTCQAQGKPFADRRLSRLLR
jgi:formamidopyrimidine-DNA glycosylase